MHRLYIENTPPIWVIDNGQGTEKEKFKRVLTEVFGITRYNLDSDNIEEPRVWLEYPTARLIKINNIAILR